MVPETVLIERQGAIAMLTLNRPAVLNALDAAMIGDLTAAVQTVGSDGAIRAVVLRGAGDAFMAGGDIRMFHATLSTSEPERRATIHAAVSRIEPLVAALRGMPKPVIAQVHGAAAGFGLSLVAACDLAVAAEDAVFTLAYCHVGTSPDGGSSFFLPRHVGVKRAFEIALLGDRFDAATAERFGLVNRVVPRANLEAETGKLAARLAAGPTQAYAETKRLLNGALESSLAEQLGREADAFADCAVTADFAEGVTAFVEKRKPGFQGR